MDDMKLLTAIPNEASDKRFKKSIWNSAYIKEAQWLQLEVNHTFILLLPDQLSRTNIKSTVPPKKKNPNLHNVLNQWQNSKHLCDHW